MNDFGYWHKQTPGTPLFADIAWQRPEQKAQAGKLLILGGNAQGFAAVAQAYNDAVATGVGECRVILPDALKKAIDSLVPDCLYVPTNASGGITKDSLPVLKASAAWADGLLFIGDAGRNSETAIVYEHLLTDFPDLPTLITRDAADLLRGMYGTLIQRPPTVLLLTFAQLQKLFQSVYYPRTLLFSMQLTNLVEALHKFTLTYPCTIVTFHQNQLLAAQDGKVSTTPWEQPLMIWRGTVGAKASVYALQQPGKVFEAVTTSFAEAS